MNPVVWNSIMFDGITKPPEVRAPAGHPKKRRIRKRSKFLNSAESPITCSVCGMKGHNKHTCPKAV